MNFGELSRYPMKKDETVCYRTGNNKYPGCPAMMNDGRAFTDFRSPCYVNNLIRVKNNIHNSYDYRQFLIHNADNIMSSLRKYNIQKNGCTPCTPVPTYCESYCSSKNGVTCSPYDCTMADPEYLKRSELLRPRYF